MFGTDAPAHPAMLPAIVVLLACWATLAVLGLAALPGLIRTWRGEAARFRTSALALTLLAIGLRAWLAPLTPEIRWRLGWSYSAGGMGIEDVQKYGLGLPLLTRLVVGLTGPIYEVPFALNVLLGGLCVLPMIGLVRAVGAGRGAALWCGFALAVTPMLVWFSHTDSPFIADTLASLLAFWGVARYARSARPLWLVVVVASVVTAAQMRVEAVATAAFAILLALALTPGFPWRRPATWVALLATPLLLIPHAALVGEAVLGEVDRRSSGLEADLGGLLTLDHYIAFEPTMQSLTLIVMTPLGLLYKGVGWTVRAWALLAMFAMGAVIADVHPSETAFSAARYQLRSLPFAALLAGFGMAWVASVRGGRWLSLLVIASALWGLRLARTESVLRTEHEVFRAHLDEVGDPCTIMSWLDQNDTTLFPPTHLSWLEGHEHEWRDILHEEVPTSGCVAYWRSGGCTGHYQSGVDDQMGLRHPVCERFEAAWVLEPIAEARLEPDPMGPMGVEVRFPDAPMEVGFYRVVGPSEGAAQPGPR